MSFSKTTYQKEVKKIISQIVRNYKPEKIILFGSAASGELYPQSDIDLLIIKDTKERYWDRVKKVIYSYESSYPVDVFVWTPSEFKKKLLENRFFLTHEILPKGKVVYEKVVYEKEAVSLSS